MVSVITLNFNQNEYTLKCVESILKSNYHNFQLLLIDNGSKVENFKKLKENLPKDSKLKLLRINDNLGYVGGINFGLLKSKKMGASHVMILNNDTLLDSNAIKTLISTSNDFDHNSIVTGKVYHYNEPNKLQNIGYLFGNKRTLQFKSIGLNEDDVGQFNDVSERDMLDDIFWLFSIKLYDQIGGYCPYFWFNAEQADFALRAKKKGYKLIYSPNAKLWHKGSVSIGGRDRNPKLAYWNIQSSLILRYIHLNKLNFLVYFILILNSVLSTNVKSIYYRLNGNKGWKTYAYAKRKGLMYFLNWIIFKNINIGKNPF